MHARRASGNLAATAKVPALVIEGIGPQGNQGSRTLRVRGGFFSCHRSGWRTLRRASYGRHWQPGTMSLSAPTAIFAGGGRLRRGPRVDARRAGTRGADLRASTHQPRGKACRLYAGEAADIMPEHIVPEIGDPAAGEALYRVLPDELLEIRAQPTERLVAAT